VNSDQQSVLGLELPSCCLNPLSALTNKLHFQVCPGSKLQLLLLFQLSNAFLVVFASITILSSLFAPLL